MAILEYAALLLYGFWLVSDRRLEEAAGGFGLPYSAHLTRQSSWLLRSTWCSGS